MKKILFVTPWGITTRRPRALGFVEMLSEEFDVHVFSVAWSKAEEIEAKQIKAASVTVVRGYQFGGLWRTALGLLSSRSLQQAYVGSRHLRYELAQLEAQITPDVAFFNVIRSGHLARALTGNALKVLDLDEFRSEYYRQVASGDGGLLSRGVARLEGKRMAAAEARALEEYDLCFVSSPTDLARDESVRLIRSPHLPVATLNPPSSREANIVFVGRMSYAANQNAILWFRREVLPILASRAPSFTLKVVGEGPPDWLVRKLAHPQVEIVGSVDEVAPYYANATVVIVPIITATGVQMKLIESLAAGRPTVVSPLVARLAGVNESQCWIAGSPDDWADCVLEILGGGSDVDAVAAQGRVWADLHHGYNAVQTSLLTAIQARVQAASSKDHA